MLIAHTSITKSLIAKVTIIEASKHRVRKEETYKLKIRRGNGRAFADFACSHIWQKTMETRITWHGYSKNILVLVFEVVSIVN